MTGAIRRSFVRSGAAYAVPLALALEVPTLLETKDALGRNWPTTIEVANGSASLLVVLGAVASAAVAMPWHRHEHLLAPLPRAWVHRLLPAGLVAGGLVAAHLLWVAGVCLATAPGTAGAFEWWPLVPVPLAVLAGCLVGALVGAVSRSWLAPPFVGLALFVALVALSGGRLSHLVHLGGVGQTLTGVRFRDEVAQVQSVWFAALALAAGLVVVALRRTPGRLVVSVAVGVVVVPMGASAAVSAGADRFEVDDVDWVCVGSGPAFCHLPEDATAYRTQAGRLGEAAQRLRAVGAAQLPQVVWQRLDLPVDGHDAQVSLRPEMSDRDLVLSLLTGLHPCSDAWTYEQFLVAEAVAYDVAVVPLDETSARTQTTAPVDRLAC